MRIAEINIYPVKALRPLRGPGGVDVGARGIHGDRRFMIVDADGVFISQRELPALARLAVCEDAAGPILSGPDGALPLAVPRRGPRRRVRIWGDVVDAAAADPAVDATLSRWLGRPVGVVFMDRNAHRPVDPAWGGEGVETSFADGFPILIACTASLAELNRRMAARGAAPVGMERFRPNLVVETDEPFVEDTWARIAAGDVELDLVKPCTRCVVTTTDQETGAVAADNEPLATLATFRRSRDRATPGVLFGWNAIPRTFGHLYAGLEVEVLARRPAPWPTG